MVMKSASASSQGQYFLLSYLKTLSVGPAGPHSNPMLNQLSQPVSG